MITVGNSNIQQIDVGDQAVANIYIGDNHVYTSGPIVDSSLQSVLDEGTSNGYVLPSQNNINLLDDFIIGLKGAGFWSKLDVLYIFANDGDAGFRSINYINPELKGAPSDLQASKHGFVAEGSATSLFDTNFNPTNSGVNYTLNSASRGVWIFKASDASALIDAASTNQNMLFNSVVNSHRINSGTSGVVSGTRDMSGLGYKAINRSDAEVINLYNGKTQLADTRLSTAMPNFNQRLFVAGTNYSSAGISVYYMGGSLTQQEHSDFADIISAYISNLGPVAPVLSAYSIESVQGSSDTVTATVPSGITVVWKDSTNTVIQTGTTFSVPTGTEGLFTYYAHAVNAEDIESEPSILNVEVKSINNMVLISPMHTYSEEGTDVVINYLTVPGVDVDYYDSSDNLIQSGGNLTLSGLTAGTHEYYAIPSSGATEYNQVPITVITLAAYPVVDMDTMHTLTIDDGLVSDLIYNEEAQPNKGRLLPHNSIVNNIILNNPDYTFSPRATSVIMDADKNITFTANGN